MTEKKTKLEKILDKENITEQEAIAVIKSAKAKPYKTEHLGIARKHFKYGYISDTHIGHKEFIEPLWDKAVRMFDKESVDFIVHAGDHLEGMSHRAGHVYELSHIGFNEQIKKAAELYNQLPNVPIYGIDGNHDQWYFKPQNMGMVAGDELEMRVNNYKNLGQDEGDIQVTPHVKIKLFHANDGTAYATSYKLQKLIESFEEKDKPSIVHSGHYHKALYLYTRGVHGFECGTMCGQTKFMRGKKIPANIGFGLVEVYHNKNGVDRLEHLFVPYEKK